MTIKNLFVKLIREEEGATAAEYGLLVAFVLAIIAVGVKTFGKSVDTAIGAGNSALQQ